MRHTRFRAQLYPLDRPVYLSRVGAVFALHDVAAKVGTSRDVDGDALVRHLVHVRRWFDAIEAPRSALGLSGRAALVHAVCDSADIVRAWSRAGSELRRVAGVVADHELRRQVAPIQDGEHGAAVAGLSDEEWAEVWGVRMRVSV